MTINQAQTLMDYLTPTLGDTNTILLPKLPEGITFDFKHGFLQMLENNLFNGAAHENPMQSLRKFIDQHGEIGLCTSKVYHT